MAIDGNYIIEKRNILNELRAKNMTLQELRLFNIYLAKINPRNINTRKVRFNLEDFKSVMNLGRLNIDQLKKTTDSLLSKIVQIPNEKGGYQSFVLFQECNIDIDDNGVWFIEIDASNVALEYMFNFRRNYFNYKLWNALSLKSANQLRMYEILKQYENLGELVIDVDELKERLGVDSAYDRFDSFKTRVLDACQKALEEYTDIKFTYEKALSGKGGKWIKIRFIIEKNEKFDDTLGGQIEELLSDNPEDDSLVEECKARYLKSFSELEYKYLRGLCDNNLLIAGIEDNLLTASIMINSLNYLGLAQEKQRIDNPTMYLAKIIDDAAEKEKKKILDSRKSSNGINSDPEPESYDLSRAEEFAVTFSGNRHKNKF